MKRIYNSVGIIFIALVLFFLSGFFSFSSEERFDIIEENLIEDITIRTLGFWLLGFVLLAVLAVVNRIYYSNSPQSNFNLFSAGAIVNLVFALLGSLVFFLV